ncbi:MAG: hypothetical protein DCC55_06920 [Chloroflexi bacterium]|nr:MAG: hypothetical protein DCC55_06920 [Chloroflexota bacterium]
MPAKGLAQAEIRGCGPAKLVLAVATPAAAAGTPTTASEPVTTTGTPVVSHGGPVEDYISLIDNLRAAGATVEPVGPVAQPFLAINGQVI